MARPAGCVSWPERYPGEVEAFIAARVLDMANFVLNDPNPRWKREAGSFLARLEGRLKKIFTSLEGDLDSV